jgi:hypothetical protein
MKMLNLNKLLFALATSAFFAAALTNSPVWAADAPAAPTIPPKPCPRPVEYWKHHLKHSGVTNLTIGGKVYTAAELRRILHMNPKGDQSVILGQQCIAAKLNFLHGCDPTPIRSVSKHANTLLRRPGKLPYHIYLPRRPSLAMAMDAAAIRLYNERELTPDCKK